MIVHDIRFVWGQVDNGKEIQQEFIGHLINLGDPLTNDHTYCSIPISELINKKLTKRVIEKFGHSVCVTCMKRNKEILAKRFNIKGWAH